MDIHRTLSNIGTYVKFHKGEICAIGAGVTSVAAVTAAIIEAPKARENMAANIKTMKELDKNSETYKKDLAKATAKTAGNAVRDLKFTIGFEVASVALTAIGCSSMRKTITSTSTALAGVTSLLALTEDAIESEYGSEGLNKIKMIRNSNGGIAKTIKTIDPVTGEVHETEVREMAPDLEWLDLNAKELLEQQPAEVQAVFDPTSTVLLDDDSVLFRSCHGDLDLLDTALKCALDSSNHYMWMHGRIRLRNMLDDLEFTSLNGRRFNQDIMDMAGTIDNPSAYDMISKKWIRVKGFDEAGKCEDRKKYGDYSHKYLSYGEDQDKFLFSRPEASDHPYFIIDGKILLQLSYDGNINNLLIGGISPERLASAWTEHPEMEK